MQGAFVFNLNSSVGTRLDCHLEVPISLKCLVSEIVSHFETIFANHKKIVLLKSNNTDQ